MDLLLVLVLVITVEIFAFDILHNIGFIRFGLYCALEKISQTVIPLSNS